MASISTRNLNSLPDISTLKQLCKALATLDAIICREWEFRYYSYNKDWDTVAGEEYFSMRNGSGDEFQILFNDKGCVINGFAHESEMSSWIEKTVEPKNLKKKIASVFSKKETVLEQKIWEGVVDKLPPEFHEFIFGEPIKSKGTTFCIWRKTGDVKWNIGDVKFPDDNYGDGSAALLYILDNDPRTYTRWATEYYEEQFEEDELKLELVKQVYSSIPINRELALGLNPALEEFETLKADLDEVGYVYKGF
jgi:hypothetical protein